MSSLVGEKPLLGRKGRRLGKLHLCIYVGLYGRREIKELLKILNLQTMRFYPHLCTCFWSWLGIESNSLSLLDCID